MKKQIISVKAEPLRFPLITCSNRAKAYTEIKLFCTVTCLKAEPLRFPLRTFSNRAKSYTGIKLFYTVTCLILAAVLAVGTFSAMPVSAAIDMENLPVPLSNAKEASEKFERTIPKLKSAGNGSTLSWEAVEGALYYNIYKKDANGAYKETASTFDTKYGTGWYGYYGSFERGEYKVRAVTYTYSDKKVYSRFSNAAKLGYEAEDAPCGSGVEGDYEEEYDEAYDDDADTSYSEAADVSSGAPPVGDDDCYEDLNTEEYGSYAESGYKNVAISPLSTFSADVDTASYANLRRLINDNRAIPADAVRIEEMLNYFDYDYVQPKNNAFKINTELSDCPWNSRAQLLTVGIQGKDLAETPNSNLVFLVDTSGSMSWEDKLPLAVKSIKMLSKTMNKNDRISIVTYSGEERVILAGARGTQVKTVSDLTSLLDADGSTNGESGIKAAYALAEKYYIEGGNNRIIMMTDGDLNVGISSEDELKRLIEEKRNSGVYFSVLGFGDGNIKDNKMETLADNGNGSYHYIDTAKEAAKVLVEERNSTLYTIAKDVKIQVEFNPANVKSYRLIGYDNRRLENEDFTDDTKDAGDVGAGHSVTAVYEIIPADGKTGQTLKYQQNSKTADTDDLLTVKVRYKDPESLKSVTITSVVNKNSYSKTKSENMKLVCAVTEFGLTVKNSDYKGDASAAYAYNYAKSLKDPDTYEKELAKLIDKYMKQYENKDD